MKIALLTIHNANNYGAILQTFALQTVLSTYGKVEIIDYNNRHISRSLDLIRLKPSLHGLLGMGKDIFRLYPRHKVIKKFKIFSNEYINKTKEYNLNNIQNCVTNAYDIYIAGSDQIWNPSCISNNCIIDKTYFLSFVPEGIKKVSYASSIGKHIYSDDEKKIVKNSLNDFFAVSVREKDGQTQLENILDKNVEHVLDPTLLLSKDEWIKALDIKNYNSQKEKYILVYSVPKSPLIKNTTEYFKKKLGLKVISIDQDPFTFSAIDQHIKDAGPLNYLELFLNAEFIITDSFHGTCYSLNFEKQFVSVSPGVHSNRIESLLSLLKTADRILNNERDCQNIDNAIDYNNVRKKLIDERKKSLSFLDKALQGYDS